MRTRKRRLFALAERAIVKKPENNKGCQGRGKSRALMCCWQEYDGAAVLENEFGSSLKS